MQKIKKKVALFGEKDEVRVPHLPPVLRKNKKKVVWAGNQEEEKGLKGVRNVFSDPLFLKKSRKRWLCLEKKMR